MGLIPHSDPFFDGLSSHPVEMAADAVVDLLETGGPEQVAMAPVARWLKVTPSALHHWHGSRADFVTAVVGRIAWRWAAWATRPQWGQVIPIRLPESRAEIRGLRAWEVIRTLAAGEERAGRPAPAQVVAAARADHRSYVFSCLRTALRRDPTDHELETALALGDGLCARIVSTHEPLPAREGREILRTHFGTTLGLELQEGDFLDSLTSE